MTRPFLRLPVLCPVYCPETRPHLAVGLAAFLVVHEMSMVVGSCVTARCPCIDSARLTTENVLEHVHDFLRLPSVQENEQPCRSSVEHQCSGAAQMRDANHNCPHTILTVTFQKRVSEAHILYYYSASYSKYSVIVVVVTARGFHFRP